MKWFLMLLVLLQSCALVSCVSDGGKNRETLSEVKDDWIDPHNMVDDHHAGWIKKNGDNTHSTGINIMEGFTNKYSEEVIRRAFSNIREELKNCERKLEAISSSSFLNTETIVLLICLVLWLTAVIVFEMTTRLTARQQFIYLCVTSFIVSIPWEWYRLYKIEFAKKQSIMMESLQKHCHTDHKLGPVESVSLWWRSSFSSSCAKYQEAMLVDAVWEVSPAMALWQPLVFLACLVIIICLFLKPQDMRRQQHRQAEAVEHPDGEVAEGNLVPERQDGRLRHPVQASELNPTKNTGPD